MKMHVEVNGFDPSDEFRDEELQEVENLIEHCSGSISILNSAWDRDGERRDMILHVHDQEYGDAAKKIKAELEDRGFEVGIEEETFV